MRDNGPITNREVLFPDETLLVSQTDTGGRITFVNDAFVAISGFTRDELLGSLSGNYRSRAEALRADVRGFIAEVKGLDHNDDSMAQ